MFFIGYGLAFVFAPTGMFYWVAQDALSSAAAQVDLRATYGGMTLAVGLFMLYLYRRGFVDQTLIFISVVLLSMALARGLGFALDGVGNTLMVVYLVLELVGASLALVALRHLAREM